MLADLPILDSQALKALKDDVGAAIVVRLITSLKAEIRASEKKMHEFCELHEMKSCENLAHGLKSAVRSFGALKLGGVCALIEENARTKKDKALFESQLIQFKDIADDTIAALENYM